MSVESEPSARAYLRSRSWLGGRFGLSTMRALCRELGRPERAFDTLLIAGTNGKGSVCAYLDAGLRGAGLRVGRYTSPHLEDVRERIVIDGRRLSEGRFVAAIEQVRRAALPLLARGAIREHPHHFEILTAAAFLVFQDAAIDVAVLEVGLGGRLDATNVADPLVSAIVSIAFDHQAHLGSTLKAIAREKAGVARRERPLVLGPIEGAALDAIRAVASRVGARVAPTCAFRLRGSTLITLQSAYPGVRPLAGAHQVANIAVSAGVIEEYARIRIARRRDPLDVSEAMRSMSGAEWPGRLELIPSRPAVLLDGAHNEAGAETLARFLARRRRAGGVLIFGAMGDKPVARMAELLFPLFRSVVLTRVRVRRAMPPGVIAMMATATGRSRKGLPIVRIAANPERALVVARHLAGSSGTIVVAGSLYLVGAVRRLVTRAERRRTTESPARSGRIGSRGRGPVPAAPRSSRRGKP